MNAGNAAALGLIRDFRKGSKVIPRNWPEREGVDRSDLERIAVFLRRELPKDKLMLAQNRDFASWPFSQISSFPIGVDYRPGRVQE